jgi:VanZ family protein
MKKNLLKFTEYLYYLSLVTLFILYLFPGSLLGYLFYGDLQRQPILIDNFIGTSINHFFFFIYLTIIAFIFNTKKSLIINNINFIFLIAIFLEFTHFVIPNRAFELYDLLANLVGVLIIFLCRKLIK